MTFAEELRNQILAERGVSRISAKLRKNPDQSIETSLSYKEATDLGFICNSSQFGTHVSLPSNSQFGDH